MPSRPLIYSQPMSGQILCISLQTGRHTDRHVWTRFNTSRPTAVSNRIYVVACCDIPQRFETRRRGSREWCRRQAFESVSELVWPWTLTSGPQVVRFVSCPCPVDHLCQLTSESVNSFSKHRVHVFDNTGTNGRTDGRTRPRTLVG